MPRKLLLLFIAASLSLSVSAQLKGDPWIFQAYKETYGRDPNAWELNIQNYNQGSWNNYGELKKYITEYQASLSSNGLVVITYAIDKDRYGAAFNQNGKTVAADVVSGNGGKILSAGGEALVAAGGGNMVAAGGGNMVAAGGGNIKDLPGVTHGSQYAIKATGTRIIRTSGKGALIIKK